MISTDLYLAYIDPSAGVLLFQTMVAGAIGASIYFRRTLGGLLRRMFGKRNLKTPEKKDPQ